MVMQKSPAERAPSAAEEVLKPSSAQARFETNSQQVMEELAQQMRPENPAKYARAIQRSLERFTSSTEDLWQHLESQGCQTARIEKGVLRFYTAAGEKIDVQKFMQPLTGKVETDLDRVSAKRRAEVSKEIFANTKQELALLIQDIPNAPEFPGSSQSPEAFV